MGGQFDARRLFAAVVVGGLQLYVGPVESEASLELSFRICQKTVSGVALTVAEKTQTQSQQVDHFQTGKDQKYLWKVNGDRYESPLFEAEEAYWKVD